LTLQFTHPDIGANLGMYSVVVAAMNRQVVAVDADPHNLAYIRKSLDLEGNTHNVRIIYNSVRSCYQMIWMVVRRKDQL